MIQAGWLGGRRRRPQAATFLLAEVGAYLLGTHTRFGSPVGLMFIGRPVRSCHPLLRAYGEFRDRAGRLMTGRGSKTALVEAAVERRIRPFAISEIEDDCPGVSRDMIRHVLRRLRDEGRVEVRGRGRGARWEVLGEQSGT